MYRIVDGYIDFGNRAAVYLEEYKVMKRTLRWTDVTNVLVNKKHVRSFPTYVYNMHCTIPYNPPLIQEY